MAYANKFENVEKLHGHLSEQKLQPSMQKQNYNSMVTFKQNFKSPTFNTYREPVQSCSNFNKTPFNSAPHQSINIQTRILPPRKF